MQQALDCYAQGLEANDCAEELCRASLAATLGIAPAPETEGLHRALRAGQ